MRKRKHGERYGRPEDPGAEFSPLGVCPVRDDAHDRIERCIPESADKKEGPGGCGCNAEDIGIKAELEDEHRLEDKVGCRVAETVADFFSYGEFFRRCLQRSPVNSCVERSVPIPRERHSGEILIAGGDPTITAKSPGSTASTLSILVMARCSGEDVERRRRRFPRLEEDFANPFNSFTGRVTELTRSRMYIWTTSAPAR